MPAADHEAPLSPEDLERLAMAAYLVGRDDDSADIWGSSPPGCWPMHTSE
jgi:hypothetical protein